MVLNHGFYGDVLLWANTHRGHGDDGPIESCWQGYELIGVGVLLHHEGEAREDKHPHDHHQGQQAQLLVACLKRVHIRMFP